MFYFTAIEVYKIINNFFYKFKEQDDKEVSHIHSSEVNESSERVKGQRILNINDYLYFFHFVCQ